MSGCRNFAITECIVRMKLPCFHMKLITFSQDPPSQTLHLGCLTPFQVGSSISKQNLFQTGSNVSFSCGGETRVPLWLQSSEDMEKCSKDLAHCHAYLVEMSQLLQSMDVLHRTYSAPAINAIQGGAFESPKKEKRSQRRWRSRAIGKDAKGTLQVPKPFSGHTGERPD